MVRSLSSAYKLKGRGDEAIALLEELVVTCKSKLGPDHLETLNTLETLASTVRDLGDRERAGSLFLEALALKKQKFPADDPAIAHTLALLGWNCFRQNRYVEAETIQRECLAIRAKREPNSWQFFETHRAVGASLLGQKRYAEAEPHLVQGYEGMKQRELSVLRLNDRAAKLTEGLEQLVQLYEEWGKPDEAARWRTVLDARQSAPKAP
jgi:tetratricopeptide (TPR) repeat protein